MGECATYFDQMTELRSRRLDDQTQQELFTHLASCASCRDLLDFHGDLRDAGDEFEGPSEVAFAALRSRVLDEINSSPSASATIHRPIWKRPQYLAAAASVLILLGGFIVGRTVSARTVSETDLLIAALEGNASRNLRLQDVEDSQTMISNVAVRPLENGRVALAFDVAQHLELQRNENDPLVNEVLVHAMLDRSSLGSRLKAVSIAGAATNGKVQEALIFAMTNDPDLPVRLRALEILTANPFGPAVEAGLLEVLKRDDSMQMRLLAVENLAQGDPSLQRLFDELEASGAEFVPALAERVSQLNNS